MTRYIIRRTIQSIFLMLITTIIGFTIFQAAPGSPLQFMDDDPRVKQADIARLERSYGVDRSIPVQYVAWAFGEDWLPAGDTWRSGRCQSDPDDCSRGVIRLDFGRSFMFKGERVIDKIVERIPATLWLALSSLLISMVVGFPLGVLSAMHRGRWPDNGVRIFTVLFSTVPEWWLGLLLLIILGGYLGLVPLSGMCDIGDCSWRDRLHHLILPATVSAISGWIYYSRVLRFEMLEVLNQDYVRTARAKGLHKSIVMRRHILRNAIMPFVTGLGGIFLIVLSGSVLFETVFSWPGMGRLFIQAINARDYPLMMANFVIAGFLGILGLLMVDILYGFVDPRVKYE